MGVLRVQAGLESKSLLRSALHQLPVLSMQAGLAAKALSFDG